MSARGPSIAEIATDFAPLAAGLSVEPFSAAASTFDARLREAAAAGCHRLLETTELDARTHGWTADAAAYGSGIEAWLQYELLTALSAAAPAQHRGPVVVHVARGAQLDAIGLAGERCRHIVVPADQVDAHVALLVAVQTMRAAAPEVYEGERRWCHTNLIGGGQVEALARADVGLAYMAMLSLFGWEGAWEAASALGEPCEWAPHAASAAELERMAGDAAGRVGVERLVRAPLRFTAARLLRPQETEEDGPFRREMLADLAALLFLVGAEQEVRVGEVPRAALFPASSAAIGMAVALQLTRVRRLRAGTLEAVRRLCLAGAEAPPTVRRLGRIEVQMRCMWASAMALRPLGDDRAAHSLTFAFDEMQVVFGLACALQLTGLGASVVLDRLCVESWEEVADHWETMVRDLDGELTLDDPASA